MDYRLQHVSDNYAVLLRLGKLSDADRDVFPRLLRTLVDNQMFAVAWETYWSTCAQAGITTYLYL
jgi:hypothetical protein